LNRRQTEIPFGKTNNFLGGEDAVLSVHHEQFRQLGIATPAAD
jgi:hypothetical protein